MSERSLRRIITTPRSTNVLRRFFIDRMRRRSMLKRCLVVTGMLVALALWSASEANAQTFYNLTLQSCGGGGCGTSPFGTVELQQGVNSVIVTVTLTPVSDRFSAGGNDVLTFNLS